MSTVADKSPRDRVRINGPLYRYVHNSPTNMTDPSGMFPDASDMLDAQAPPPPQGPTDREKVLAMAKGDQKLIAELKLLFKMIDETKVSAKEWWSQGGHCHAWANKTMTNLLDAQIKGEMPSLSFSQPNPPLEYKGSFPLWFDHNLIKVTLPDGQFFYVDNFYLGGDDHVFFDIPDNLKERGSKEWEEYFQQKCERYRNWEGSF